MFYYQKNDGLQTWRDGVVTEPYLTLIPPPVQGAVWSEEQGNWQVTDATRQTYRAQKWEQIKQYRYNNLRGGIYLPSIKKWLHTDDASRQQYIFMLAVGQLPENLQWKTMDGTFIGMTKALLTELSLRLMQSEQADFANAERHRVALEASEEPWLYDFSDGWEPIYYDGIVMDETEGGGRE